jgi:hypothetical protein
MIAIARPKKSTSLREITNSVAGYDRYEDGAIHALLAWVPILLSSALTLGYLLMTVNRGLPQIFALIVSCCYRRTPSLWHFQHVPHMPNFLKEIARRLNVADLFE